MTSKDQLFGDSGDLVPQEISFLERVCRTSPKQVFQIFNRSLNERGFMLSIDRVPQEMQPSATTPQKDTEEEDDSTPLVALVGSEAPAPLELVVGGSDPVVGGGGTFDSGGASGSYDDAGAFAGASAGIESDSDSCG